MKFEPRLQQGILVRRYKRFLADVIFGHEGVTTVHCPNTGSMKNCIAPQSPCWFSTSDNPKRKYPMTWEVATTPAGDLAGVNTSRSNALVREAIATGVIAELCGYDSLRSEVPYGEERSRIDILLQRGDQRCYVEVKNVTLCDGGGRGLFPDAVSSRGAKHLRELTTMVAHGHRAVLVYCVQHSAIDWVEPADDIDPVYGETLRDALEKGVEALAYRASISADEIVLQEKIPVLCQ